MQLYTHLYITYILHGEKLPLSIHNYMYTYKIYDHMYTLKKRVKTHHDNQLTYLELLGYQPTRYNEELILH